MPLRAALFDVGDTLVEHWAPRDVVNERARAQICAEMGEQPWLEELLEAELEPVAPLSLTQSIAARRVGSPFEPESSRQETNAWYRAWFEARGIDVQGIDLDRLRSLMCVPLAEISTPVHGAFEAVKWCRTEELRVVLVTNTLSRGDAEVLADWERFGLADTIDGVVSSHSVGWRKPHPSIFERALEIAGVPPAEAFHVGDNLVADVYGAQQLGMRAVWRRKPRLRPRTDPGDGPLAMFDVPRSDCRHPSQDLTLVGGEVVCVSCGGPGGIEIRPDAVIDDLTELPRAVERWLR